MKRLIFGLAAASLIASPVALAQGDNQRDQRRGSQTSANDRHAGSGQQRNWHKDRGQNRNWARGERMGYNDWNNARRIDHRRYNLRQPPVGYEWRGNNDRYFMVDSRNGYVASVILSSRVRNRGDGYGWGENRGNNYRWGRGQRMGYNDWNNARRIDYRRYNLRQPPRGYEWRRSNDRFVLVALTTGVIAAVILSKGR